MDSTRNHSINRRHFVRLLAGGALAFGSSAWLACGGKDEGKEEDKNEADSRSERKEVIVHLAEIFPDLDSVCYLGSQILLDRPEASTDSLLDDLFDHFDFLNLNSGDATEALKSQIQRDYAEGSTVIVEQWTLSKSEALFYALTARLSCESQSSSTHSQLGPLDVA